MIFLLHFLKDISNFVSYYEYEKTRGKYKD